jgi:hypothetical protein
VVSAAPSTSFSERTLNLGRQDRRRRFSLLPPPVLSCYPQHSERTGKLSDFILAFKLYRNVNVAHGELFGDIGHRPERPADNARYIKAQDQGHGDAGQYHRRDDDDRHPGNPAIILSTDSSLYRDLIEQLQEIVAERGPEIDKLLLCRQLAPLSARLRYLCLIIAGPCPNLPESRSAKPRFQDP